MRTLRFDSEEHKYWLEMEGGLAPPLFLPSVSKAIDSVGIYNYPKTAHANERMRFGTRMHKLTTLFDTDLVKPADLEDPEESLYLHDYEEFASQTGFVPDVIERPMFHPYHLYAGTPDRVGNLIVPWMKESRYAVIDIKTGQPHPATNLQLAAYFMLAKENGLPVQTAFALYIGKGYRLIQIEDFDTAWSTFLAALTICQWKEVNLGGRTPR